MRRTTITTLAILLLQTCAFAATDLPKQGPLPDSKPTATKPAETSVEKPDTETVTDQKDKTATEAEEETPNPEEEKEVKAPAPPPVETEDPAAYAGCIADLKAIGASFREVDRIDDGNGCGIDKPLIVDKVLPGVSLSPPATIRCETALQLARTSKQFIIPAARTGLPGKAALTSINQASGYVCRLRNSAKTGKISEHARGNGIDIASLSFGKTTVPMRIVKQEDSTLEDAFQRTFNAAACLYFTTVLSPGSDAAHQDHMHLDVIERRGGYRYCR